MTFNSNKEFQGRESKLLYGVMIGHPPKEVFSSIECENIPIGKIYKFNIKEACGDKPKSISSLRTVFRVQTKHGGISGVGTYFLVGGLYALNHKSDDAGDEVFTAIAGGAMLGISITLYLVGIPVLAYNIYKYNVHKNHAIKRDECNTFLLALRFIL